MANRDQLVIQREQRKWERLQAEEEALKHGMRSTLARALKNLNLKEALAKEALEAHERGRSLNPVEAARLRSMGDGVHGGIHEILPPEEYAALWDRDLDDVG